MNKHDWHRPMEDNPYCDAQTASIPPKYQWICSKCGTVTYRECTKGKPSDYGCKGADSMGILNDLNKFDVDLADFDKRIQVTCGSSSRDIITNSACHRILERATKDPYVDTVDIYALVADSRDDAYIEKVRLRPKLIPAIRFDFTTEPIDLTDNDITYNNLVHYRDGVHIFNAGGTD